MHRGLEKRLAPVTTRCGPAFLPSTITAAQLLVGSKVGRPAAKVEWGLIS